MGLWDWFTGKTEQEQDIRTTEDTDIARSQLSQQVGGGSTQTGQVQQAEFLSPEVQNMLVDAMSRLSGETEGFDMAGALREMAAGTTDVLNEQISAIMDQSRMEAQRQIDQVGNQLATAVGGSTGNSAVAELRSRNIGDVMTQLAGEEGRLRIGAQQAGLEALSSGIEGTSEAAAGYGEPLAALGEIIKGATARTETQQVENQVTQLIEALEELTEGRTFRTGTESGERTGSIFDILRLNANIGR